jgi:hypothetical protein
VGEIVTGTGITLSSQPIFFPDRPLFSSAMRKIWIVCWPGCVVGGSGVSEGGRAVAVSGMGVEEGGCWVSVGEVVGNGDAAWFSSDGVWEGIKSLDAHPTSKLNIPIKTINQKDRDARNCFIFVLLEFFIAQNNSLFYPHHKHNSSIPAPIFLKLLTLFNA